ncbi:MAG TPA: isoaspartyl peptidase/L-asparaginase, partial [Gammaproteobacteria bacterium]|nr:isoaspartyl peptidase/L-asparaginase [Gammaproteobacteria bacterium]
MERSLTKLFSISLLCLLTGMVSSAHHDIVNFGLVVHGGSGMYSGLTKARAKAYKEGIDAALVTGYKILEKGGTSLDAVTTVVTILEDLPQFNAGKGAVYTSAEVQEMDASIMDGASGKGGAVASVSHIKNPILLSRAVMEKSEHVMLVSKGAEQFALSVGIELVDPSYFYSEKNLNRVRKNKKDKKMGTVGAVALDKNGNLSAATSTGGRSNKMPGRVGDSPILGAGTWAQNGLCAVSGTGQGEYFMRLLTAADVCKLMEYS